MDPTTDERLSRYVDAALLLRSEVEHGHGTQHQARHRHEAPDLWQVIDELCTLVAETHPMTPIMDAR